MAKITGITKAKFDAIKAEVLSSALLTSDGELAFQAEDASQVILPGKAAEDRLPTSPGIVTLSAFDSSAQTAVVPEWYNIQNPNTRIPDPATIPTGPAHCVAWSPDGRYLAIGHDTAPRITIYKRSIETFTKLADPDVLPTGSVYSAEWSSDAQYLAVAMDAAPYITIYKRSGDSLTKLANPASLPTAQAKAVSWSPDGVYLTIGYSASGYLIIYKRSGDVFTKLADPATLPTGSVNGISWSPSGTYLVIGYSAFPLCMIVYKRSGDVFSKLTDPASLPINDAFRSVWSQDESFFVIGSGATSPGIFLYNRSGDVFVKGANADSIVQAYDIEMSGNSADIFVTTSSNVIVFSLVNGSLRMLPDLTSQILNAVASRISPDGRLLAIASSATPYVSIHRSSGIQPKRVPLPS